MENKENILQNADSIFLRLPLLGLFFNSISLTGLSFLSSYLSCDFFLRFRLPVVSCFCFCFYLHFLLCMWLVWAPKMWTKERNCSKTRCDDATTAVKTKTAVKREEYIWRFIDTSTWRLRKRVLGSQSLLSSSLKTQAKSCPVSRVFI